MVVFAEKCTGCRACEVACSFHHQRVFSPRIASLEIHRNEKEGKMSIVLYEDLPPDRRKGRFPCDLCAGETEPQCTKYCTPGAIAAP